MNTSRDPSTSSYGAQQFQKIQFGHKPSDVKKSDAELERVKKHVSGPANVLILLSVLSLFASMGGLLFGLSYLMLNADTIRSSMTNRESYIAKAQAQSRAGKNMSKKEKDEQKRQEVAAQAMITFWIGGVVVAGLGLLAVYTFVLVSSFKMKNLKAHKQAKVAAVLSVIPGISPLVVLGIPFGIWALSVLNLKRVKAAFG